MPQASQDGGTLTQPLKKLSLQTSSKSAQVSNNKPNPAIADSWEEDDYASSDSSDTETELDVTNTSNPTSRPSTASSSSYPSAPPPTPSSPSFSIPAQTQFSSIPYSSFSSTSNGTGLREAKSSARGERRPETTTATASRMIAAGLGVRPPRRTEEQKEYDRAVRETEKKRTKREKAEAARKQESADRAKAAVWED